MLKKIISGILGLILLSILIYLIIPKYQFLRDSGFIYRCNIITGQVDVKYGFEGPWRKLPTLKGGR